MYRFLLLQITGVLLLVAAYLLDFLELIMQADHTYSVPVFSVLCLIGVWMVSRNDFKGATWLSEKVPVLGLILTVTGVLMAVKGSAGLSPDATRVFVFTHTAQALASNMLGMAVYAWLSLSVFVKENKNG